ncbi:MAG: bifunctional oligoribonuclease/PAP phosphatase NrnA [Candidatus Zixiibacteriota bacterium]|nr:MAG: bifunctional oligoribonuclease/PAP phosphatase NrnA [candidate division Zixibacteria bacterium]
MATKIEATFSRISEYIRDAESILITGHVDPDGDLIGSQLALWRYISSLKKKVAVINEGRIPGKYDFLPCIDHYTEISEYKGDGKFDLAIVVECPSRGRCGRVASLIGRETRIINIDHHLDNEKYGEIVFHDGDASAVGEMLAEYFLSVEYKIDRDLATLLYVAILTDTGRFRFSSTTRRTMEIAGMLIELGAEPRRISDYIYYSFSEPSLRLVGRIFSGIEFFADGKICLISLDRETLKENQSESSDTEGMAEYTLFGRGVRVGGLLREIDSAQTKVSLRSRDSINVSTLAHKHGGGGHYNASGYIIALPMKEAREKLLEDLQEIVNDSV